MCKLVNNYSENEMKSIESLQSSVKHISTGKLESFETGSYFLEMVAQLVSHIEDYAAIGGLEVGRQVEYFQEIAKGYEQFSESLRTRK